MSLAAGLDGRQVFSPSSGSHVTGSRFSRAVASLNDLLGDRPRPHGNVRSSCIHARQSTSRGLDFRE